VELLWDCEGRITHLELFNMKSWVEGHLNNIAAINFGMTIHLWDKKKQ
jgi:hypothetical protein